MPLTMHNMKRHNAVRLLLVLVGLALLWLAAQLLIPARPGVTTSIAFTVEKGESAAKIADQLEQEDLIRSASAFKTAARLSGRAGAIKTGVYRLSPDMPATVVLYKLTSRSGGSVRVTIPEGFDIGEIEKRITAACAEANTLCTPDISGLTAGEFKNDFAFLRGVPDDAPLEGFLFPDTYEFSVNDSSRDMAWRMLRNFRKRYTEELRNRVKEGDRSLYEVITMASLLEREVPTFEDKRIVAGILWKRIRTGMPLQVDATLAEITDRGSRYLTYDDLEMDHPYNTYTNTGLPPGPITNPGKESIKAALNPQESKYWYYLSKPNGETVFSQSLYQHNLAKNRWLN